MRAGDPGGMTSQNTHPAVEARRRRLHQLRVRIVAAAVGLFIAVFSVIYAQMPATANTTKTKTARTQSLAAAPSAQSADPTPMTTSQS
jgi:hypothetical protein